MTQSERDTISFLAHQLAGTALRDDCGAWNTYMEGMSPRAERFLADFDNKAYTRVFTDPITPLLARFLKRVVWC